MERVPSIHGRKRCAARALRRASLGALTLLLGCYHGLGARDDKGGGTDSAGPSSAEDGDAGADDGGGDDAGNDADPLISECRKPSHEVFERLAPSCIGCHDAGMSVPLAADFVSFEQLVVYDTSLITMGDPDASALLDMLRGQAPPPLDQMPPGAVSFAELAEDGLADIAIEELEEWIEALEPCTVPPGGGSPRFARRVSAEQIKESLLDQLDLTTEEMGHTTRYPINDPTFKDVSPNGGTGEGIARFTALGGPDYLRGLARADEVSPLFVQTLGPTAQVWCRRSLTLERNALLRHVGPASTSATDETEIRKNIEYLFLRMLGTTARQDEVDAMYERVYLPYETQSGASTAWIAVCAALIRDPLWITY